MVDFFYYYSEDIQFSSENLPPCRLWRYMECSFMLNSLILVFFLHSYHFIKTFLSSYSIFTLNILDVAFFHSLSIITFFLLFLFIHWIHGDSSIVFNNLISNSYLFFVFILVIHYIILSLLSSFIHSFCKAYKIGSILYLHDNTFQSHSQFTQFSFPFSGMNRRREKGRW